MKRLFFVVFFSVFVAGKLSASGVDSMKINMDAAEKAFLEHNFQLLAQKYHVQADQALIQQARLWDNPSVYVEKNIFNPRTGGVLEGGSNAETIIQLQQLILLAGKRSNRIQLATLQSKMTEDQFYDLMRNLKFQLHTSFYNLYYLQQSLKVYEDELGTLGNLLGAFETQYQKGNISLKEVVRLRALAFSLENERLDLQRQIADEESQLNILIQPSTYTYFRPQVTDADMGRLAVENISLDQLLQTAKDNRYDLKAEKDALRYTETNYSYQKALAVPDLRVGGTYDKQGSVYTNYTGLGVGIDLPLWNRNQGNIKSAKMMIQSQQSLVSNYENVVQNEVVTAYNKVVSIENQYRKIDAKFSQDFEAMVNAIQENYARKNMSLLEFIDFFETYKESMIQVNKIKNDRLNAYEELNYVVGKNVYNK